MGTQSPAFCTDQCSILPFGPSGRLASFRISTTRRSEISGGPLGWSHSRSITTSTLGSLILQLCEPLLAAVSRPLRSGVTAYLTINIAVHQNHPEEKKRSSEFRPLQDEISEMFNGNPSPEPPKLNSYELPSSFHTPAH